MNEQTKYKLKIATKKNWNILLHGNKLLTDHNDNLDIYIVKKKETILDDQKYIQHKLALHHATKTNKQTNRKF